MSRAIGPILTATPNAAALRRVMQAGKYNALKVVTGWGFDPDGWTPANRDAVRQMAPTLLVRTVAGDPSYNLALPPEPAPDLVRQRILTNPAGQPIPDAVLREVAPWVDAYGSRATADAPLYIEIGNEPNIATRTPDEYIWVWRYWLQESVRAFRAAYPRERYPHVKLVAPGLVLGADFNVERFYQIAGDVFRQCDAVGLHAYEHYTFEATKLARTHALGNALDFARVHFPSHPWLLTEYGINDPGTSASLKGQRYARMLQGHSDPVLPAQVVAAFYYHVDLVKRLQPQYIISPDGDVALGKR